MTLICLAADKGSPGVTTTTLALAAVWPRPVLLAETDPAGSDLAYTLAGDRRHGLQPEIGLVSLAAATATPTPVDITAHTQTTPGGLPVLLGVPGPAHGRALASIWGPLGRALAAMPGMDVLADCGRLTDDSAGILGLLSHAELILLLARDDVAGIAHLRDRVASLHGSWAPGDTPRLAAAVATSQQRRDHVIAEARKVFTASHLAVALVTTVTHDPTGAATLAVGGQPRRRMADPLLLRSARRLADELGPHLSTTAQATS